MADEKKAKKVRVILHPDMSPLNYPEAIDHIKKFIESEFPGEHVDVDVVVGPNPGNDIPDA